RPLRRIIQNLIEDPLAEGMLEQRFLPDTAVYVTVDEGLLKLNSQGEYEEQNAPKPALEAPGFPATPGSEGKTRKRKDDEDKDKERGAREPELSGTGVSGGGTSDGK